MFFEDERDNLNPDSLDEFELNLDDDVDDGSIDWDELLKEGNEEQQTSSVADISFENLIAQEEPVSVKPQPQNDIQPQEENLDFSQDELKFEDDEEESLLSLQSEFDSITQEKYEEPTQEAKKDAFEVFGGETEEDTLVQEIAPAPAPAPTPTPTPTPAPMPTIEPSVATVVEPQPSFANNAMQSDDVLVDEDDLFSQLDEIDTQEFEGQEEYNQTAKKADTTSSNLLALAGAVVALILVVGLLAFFLLGKNKKEAVNPVVSQVPQPQMQAPSLDDTTEQKADVNLPDESEEPIPVVSEENAKKLKPEKKVLVQVETEGRINPFMPTIAEFEKNVYTGISAESLLPPKSYGEDMDAQELMRVAVSGILFDEIKPSAIITINSVDYFVQKGDLVDDYRVLDINRQSVVIKKGQNIYKLGVGEMLNQKTVQVGGAASYQSGAYAGARSYSSSSSLANDDEVQVNVRYDEGY